MIKMIKMIKISDVQFEQISKEISESYKEEKTSVQILGYPLYASILEIDIENYSIPSVMDTEFVLDLHVELKAKGLPAINFFIFSKTSQEKSGGFIREIKEYIGFQSCYRVMQLILK